MNRKKKSKTCRVCLRVVKVKRATSLSDHIMNKPIFSHINSIANVNICKGDGLPNKICPQCIVELEAAVSFKEKCETNNAALIASKNYLSADNHTNKTKQGVQNEFKKTIFKLEDEYFGSYALGSSYSQRNSPEAIETDTDVNECVTKPLDTQDIKEEDVDIQAENEVSDILLRRLKNAVKAEFEGSDDEDIPLTSLKNESYKSKAIDLHLQCDDCKEYFKSKCKLRVHWKRVHLKDNIMCPICQRRFGAYRSFNRHKMKPPASCQQAARFRIEHLGKKRLFYCKECDYKSTKLPNIVTHDVVHTGDRPFTCDLCGKTLKQLSSLIRHRESVHKLYKQVITCQYCGQLIKGRDSITKHLRKHTEQSVQCKVCGRPLKNKQTLKEHMLRHDGIKSVQCKFCPKKFLTASQCATHKTIHHLNRRRIYSCESCPYTTHRKTTIEKHKAKHAAGNICCITCGVFFENKQKLKVHEQSHLVRPYICNICEKSFSRKDHLTRHYKKLHITSSISNDIKDERNEVKHVEFTERSEQTELKVQIQNNLVINYVVNDVEGAIGSSDVTRITFDSNDSSHKR